MMMMVFGRCLLPMSLRHLRLRRGHKMLTGLLARCPGASLSRSSRTALSRRFIATGDIRHCGSADLYRRFKNLSRAGNAAAAVRGRTSMNIDHHESFRHMIDESLAAASRLRGNNLFASISTLALHARSISAPATGLSRVLTVFPSRWIQPSMPGFSRPSGDPRSGSRPRSQAAGDGR